MTLKLAKPVFGNNSTPLQSSQKDPSMNIDGSRILVTGGCGLVGSTTIDILLRDHKPEQIVILDNLSRGTLRNVTEILRDPRVKLIKGDIRDVDVVHAATKGMDAVIHMATLRI